MSEIPELSIPTEKICSIISMARRFDAKATPRNELSADLTRGSTRASKADGPRILPEAPR